MKSKKKSPKLKPRRKWQTGAYSRQANFNLILPYQFLLLCKLVNVTPETIIKDFMDNLSCGSWRREGRDEAKEHLINYFVMHGYGQQHYSEENIRRMFKEMDAVGLLFPRTGKPKMIDVYAKWRDEQQKYWFKKWRKREACR